MNNAHEIRFFLTASGACPVLEHLRSLPREQRKLVGAAIRLMQDHGIHADGLKVKVIKGKLCQMTASYQRVLYFVNGNIVWLLHAFQKETQQTPAAEKKIGFDRIDEVLERQKKALARK